MIPNTFLLFSNVFRTSNNLKTNIQKFSDNEYYYTLECMCSDIDCTGIKETSCEVKHDGLIASICDFLTRWMDSSICDIVNPCPSLEKMLPSKSIECSIGFKFKVH